MLDLRPVHTNDNNYKVNEEDIALKCARLCFDLELVARRPVSESQVGERYLPRAAPPYSTEWQQIYKCFVLFFQKYFTIFSLKQFTVLYN